MSSRNEPTDSAGRPQAVVIIHGIGEQRPMATLRGFVGALLDRQDDRPGDRYYSKPDTISDSYELRRIKLRRAQPDGSAPQGLNLDWPETDFYEYYWAHQMFGTTVSHVVRWLGSTLKRSLSFIRSGDTEFPRLRCLTILGLFTIAALVLTVTAVLWFEPNGLRFDSLAYAASVAVVAVALGRSMLRYFLGTVLDVVGDAARYFDVNPKNVARRYDILRGGIALLRRLHQERDVQGDRAMYRYGRIVLVGHSLGSVIAYDILRHYWGEVNGQIPVDPDGNELKSVEGFVASERDSPPRGARPYVQAPRYWRAQYALWKAISDRVPAIVPLSHLDLWRRRASCEPFGAKALADQPSNDKPQTDWQPGRWLVSDLVTMGSPLTYAPVLLAAGKADLDEKLGLRELPTCPPDRSHHVNPGHYSLDLWGEARRFDRYSILHHGACFASTRWTNLWYANDLIGGPLRAAFGRGIRDIRLSDAPFWPLKSHISYWRRLTPQPSSKRTRILEGILRPSRSRSPKLRPVGTRILQAILRDVHGGAKGHKVRRAPESPEDARDSYQGRR